MRVRLLTFTALCRERLHSHNALTCDEDRAYVTDLMLLRYIRARDHHLGAWAWARAVWVHPAPFDSPLRAWRVGQQP